MVASGIFYRLGENHRPVNSLEQKIWMKLYSLPFFNRVRFVKKNLCRAFKLPYSTTMSKGFYCSSSLLNVDENVGLGDTFILAWAPVIIGRNTSFSYRNMIITSTHDYTNFNTVIGKPVIIGKNVWITSNVTILPGVTIGDNTIIGAGSVVTKDIPSGVFAAGNPCKVIKKIDFRK